jgi:outer membrane lipoprotein LolB
MRRSLLLCCGLLLLAGCASTRLSQAPLGVSGQEALLRELPGFRLQGRASITVAGERNQPVLDWRQRAAESRLKLSGSFGVGGVTVLYSPQRLLVTGSRGEELRDAEAQQVLSEQLGFVPPFDALRYWLLGIAAPGEAPTAQAAGENGRIADLTQLQWRIQYDRWTEVATPSGVVQLPRRLTATRADLKLSVFVDRWTLQTGK